MIAAKDGATDLILEDRFRGGAIYKVPLQMTGHGEYLLFERRTRSATFYDRNMPGEGILVWHVGSRAGNDDEFNKRVDLVCADGSRLPVCWCSLYSPCMGLFFPVFLEG